MKKLFKNNKLLIIIYNNKDYTYKEDNSCKICLVNFIPELHSGGVLGEQNIHPLNQGWYLEQQYKVNARAHSEKYTKHPYTESRLISRTTL